MKATHMIPFILAILLCGCDKPKTDDIEDIPPMKLAVESTPEPIADPPSVETVPSPSAATGGESIQKPVVTCYISPPNQYCSKCELAKKWYAENRDNLAFAVEFTDKYPDWVEEFTTFHWKGKDGWMKIGGWYGGEHLVKEWEKTQ